MLSLWPLFGFAFVVGLALFWLGWRGRRIDDHPLCRRCGYDLVGSEAATIACPECGSDLSPARAVRIGHRRKLRLTLALGALMLLATLGGGGAIGYGIAKGFNFNPYKPLWMLRSEATTWAAANPTRATAAEQEILARLTNRKLSNSQITSIVDQALAAQIDASANWYPWLGDFIEQAWLNKDIGDDIAMKYVKQAIEGALTLSVSPRVREGGMMNVAVNQGPMRAGRIGTFVVDTDQRAITLDDGSIIRQGGGRGRTTVSIGSTSSSRNSFNTDLPEGKYTASMDTDIRVGLASQWGANVRVFTTSTMTSFSGSLGGRGMSQFRSFSSSGTTTGMPRLPGGVNVGPSGDPANEPKPLAQWTLTQRTPIEVVGPNADIVDVIKDDSLAPAIARSAVVEGLRVLDAGGSGMALFDCAIDLSASPTPVAFDVYARLPGESERPDGQAAGDSDAKPREWLVGTAVGGTNSAAGDPQALSQFGSIIGRTGAMSGMSMNTNLRSRGVMVEGFPADAAKVDLVLRASKRRAEDANLDRVWDGEIIIKDVPLERINPRSGRNRPSRSGPV